jgi:hypothetical protein
MSEQVIQRTALAIPGKPRVLEGALDQTASFQRAADARGDLFDQRLQLVQPRAGDMEERQLARTIDHIHPSAALDAARKMGVDYVQGFVIGRPARLATAA